MTIQATAAPREHEIAHQRCLDLRICFKTHQLTLAVSRYDCQRDEQFVIRRV